MPNHLPFDETCPGFIRWKDRPQPPGEALMMLDCSADRFHKLADIGAEILNTEPGSDLALVRSVINRQDLNRAEAVYLSSKLTGFLDWAERDRRDRPHTDFD